jgi:hypothetical protein
VDEETFGRLTTDDVEAILAKFRGEVMSEK